MKHIYSNAVLKGTNHTQKPHNMGSSRGNVKQNKNAYAQLLQRRVNSLDKLAKSLSKEQGISVPVHGKCSTSATMAKARKDGRAVQHIFDRNKRNKNNPSNDGMGR